MKKVFIIHGEEGRPDEGWFPWLKMELEKNGFQVSIPAMPDTEHPKIDTWVPYISKLVGEPDENTYLVGHSIGCQTILRYLQTLPVGKKVGGTLLVAGYTTLTMGDATEEEKEVARHWLETPLNWERIRNASRKFTAIFSNDDPDVPLDNKDVFQEKLGAQIVIEENKGHFSSDTGIKELPSALKAVLEFP